MPLDPQVKALLEQAAAMNVDLDSLPAPERRAVMDARPRAKGPTVSLVEDRLIAGPGGGLPVRIYTPLGDGPFPVLVWFHGGGWVVGNIETADGTARYLTVGAEVVVVSVDYRLAPEDKFPAAADDCYAATKWAAENAHLYKGDPRRIAVGGDSAGGNLAAAVPLMARDKAGPPLAFQLLVYPVTERNFGTSSYRDNATGYGLTKDGMSWFWDQYMRDDQDAENPYAAPMKARDLSGLPPALVITAEYDPLRDDGAAYAQRLKDAGVSTTYSCYDGMNHGFFGQWSLLDKGKTAVDQACSAMKEAFAGQMASSR